MKTIINFCPTGMIPRKSMTPHVPISPSEIIEQTHEAFEIGISMVHIHARLENGIPTYKKNIYREIIEGIRLHCPELIICASTSGRDFPEFEKRSGVIELQPDMCSLTLSSLNFVQSASVNAPDMIQKLFLKMIEHGVHPEFECFDHGMVNYGKYLIKKYKYDKPTYWNVIFGNIAGIQPSLSSMGSIVQEIPENSHIAFGGIGQTQLKTISTAIAHDYGVRVGLEDNIWMDQQKTKLATNASLIKQVHHIMKLHEKELFTSKELKLYNSELCLSH